MIYLLVYLYVVGVAGIATLFVELESSVPGARRPNLLHSDYRPLLYIILAWPVTAPLMAHAMWTDDQPGARR